MIQVVLRFERDSMELWVETHDDVTAISAKVFNQRPSLVVVQGFEKDSQYQYRTGEETNITYSPKTLSFPSVRVWGLEVTDYTDKVDNV